MKNIKWFNILSLSFMVMTIFGGYKVYSIFKEYEEGYETYDELKKYVSIDSSKNQEIDDSIIENDAFMSVDFKSLKAINNHVVAWIYIESLNINYPIVQGNDNDYYLRYLIDGSYNNSGSIFLDYRNTSNFTDKNSVIYGHNMLDGSMFSNLTEYSKQDFFDNNPFYILITPDKNYRVEIISGYVTNVYDIAWKLDFSTEDEFEEWLNATKEKSLFVSDVTVTLSDEIVTLSTCSYDFDNARFVLVGVLTEY